MSERTLTVKQQLIAGATALALAGSGASLVSAQAPTVPRLGFDITPQAIAFEGAAPQVGTGFYKLSLENKGRGQSVVALVKLKPGVTPQQFSAAVPKLKDPSKIGDLGSIVASSFAMGPADYVTTIRLENADYAFVDVTKKPVARLSFRAGPGAGGAAAAPAPTATVTLKDYRFVMPSTLKPGKQVLRTRNSGRQLHHALMMPLKKNADAVKVIRELRAGKEPRSAIGGPPSALVEVVSPGTTNDVEVNLRKGRYLFVCFLQNTPRSKPHSMLGMEKIVTVK